MTLDLRACLEYLVPGAIFDETADDYSLTVWRDPRPMPSQAQVEAAWPIVQQQRADAAAAAQTATANESTIKTQAAAALTANATYLALASPTTAQNAAQVKALTRQVNGLIRLATRRLEATT